MKPFKRSVTLRDIAEQTGYSVNTVSRVLRGKDEIAEETRQTILQAAKDLGHVGNLRASSLRSGVTYTLAVILGDVGNPHFAIMMSEIEHYARGRGYTTFLVNTDEDEQLELAAIQTALRQSVDGIILCPCQKSAQNITYLQASGVPFVLIGRRFSGLPINYVVCDDLQGGFLATERLLKAGHRDILLLGGPDYISSAAERKTGYQKAHERYGEPVKPGLMMEVPITGNECARAIDRLLEKETPFTAIVAFSDIIAWKCWACLSRHGLRVPEEVSIIGFDYVYSRLELPFQLTSISSHKRRMSAAAVDILLDAIEAGQNGAEAQPPEQVIIHTTLKEGQTVKDLPSSANKRGGGV